MQNVLGQDARIIRTMPNTPAMIGEGMTVWSQTSEVTEEQHELVRAYTFFTTRVYRNFNSWLCIIPDQTHSWRVRH